MTRLIAVPMLVSLAVLTSVRLGLDARQDQQVAEKPAARDGSSEWDTTLPRGKTREIDFTTCEGTWMSVDLSPDGQWVVFDLLGHVYRVAGAGGEAECLTQSSGVAINYAPALFARRQDDRVHLRSLGPEQPLADGRRRLESAGGLLNKDIRARRARVDADGRFILVRRSDTRPGAGRHRPGIWMYARDGGEGVELVGRELRGASWPVGVGRRPLRLLSDHHRRRLAPGRDAPMSCRARDRFAGSSFEDRTDPRDHFRRVGAAGTELERRRARAGNLARRPLAGVRAAHSGRHDLLQGPEVRPAHRAVAARSRDRRRAAADGSDRSGHGARA